jgi:hypothetical protein
MNSNRERSFAALRTTLFLALALSVGGCRVPLKTPAITMNTPVPQIDWTRLAEFAQAAGAAYDVPTEIESTYGKTNVVVRDLPDTDTRYFIYFDRDNKTQTISVRGTTSKINAWSDVNSIKVPDATLGIMLHRGFKVAADAVYADMAPLLQRDYKTRITGHSLGGAVAAILMLDLIKDGYHVEQVITFGQPRITNEAGGKNVPTGYIRIINDQDVIAQLPPVNLVYDLSGPYAHFGPEIVLHPNNTYTYSPVDTPRDVFSNDAWKNVDPDQVLDHQIKNYIDRIKTKPQPVKPL